MVEILHTSLPPDILDGRPLPGVSPLSGRDWISVDEVYAEQVAYRRRLIGASPDLVVQETLPFAQDALQELFETALDIMSAREFSISGNSIICPDGFEISLDRTRPLTTLGQCLQQDLCLMVKQGEEHVLAAAVLCFPASWTLSEKIGRPLTAIHIPVPQYDANIARRVQRLFDGVRVGAPLRRNNYLRYDSPDLFQPLSETDPQRQEPPSGREKYLRAERQVIVRLPKTQAVVFSIHSYVVRA